MSRVNFNQSGYVGSSKSVRAIEAEEEGKLPLSRAVKVVAAENSICQKDARALLNAIGPCEWHHTGKFANRTNYYDCGDAARLLSAWVLAKTMPTGWKERLEQLVGLTLCQPMSVFAFRNLSDDLDTRSYQWAVAIHRLADELGWPCENCEQLIRDAYYHLKG